MLIAASVLMFYVAYQYAFSNSIKTYQQVSALEEELTLLKTAPQRINHLQQELGEVNAIIGEQSMAEIQFHDNLIDVVTAFCDRKKVKMTSIGDVAISQQGEVSILTTQVGITGSFSRLTQLIYEMETQEHLGKISSVNYWLKEGRGKKKDQLNLKIYIQNIIKKDL